MSNDTTFTDAIKTAFEAEDGKKAAKKVSEAFEALLGNEKYTFREIVESTALNVYDTIGSSDNREEGFYSAFFGGKVLGLSNTERKMIRDQLNTKTNQIVTALAKASNKISAKEFTDLTEIRNDVAEIKNDTNDRILSLTSYTFEKNAEQDGVQEAQQKTTDNQIAQLATDIGNLSDAVSTNKKTIEGFLQSTEFIDAVKNVFYSQRFY